jgi:hypothetical protein
MLRLVLLVKQVEFSSLESNSAGEHNMRSKYMTCNLDPTLSQQDTLRPLGADRRRTLWVQFLESWKHVEDYRALLNPRRYI